MPSVLQKSANAAARERDARLSRLFGDLLRLERERDKQLRSDREQLAFEVATGGGGMNDAARVLDRVEALEWNVKELAEAVQAFRLGARRGDREGD